MLISSHHAAAQDILVTNNGELLKVYHLEIGQNTIYYHLEENTDTDIKHISKKDVMIIKKQDGTKIDPNEAAQSISQQNANTNSTVSASSLIVNPNLTEDNLKLVREFNDRKVTWTSDNDKKANYRLYQLAITEGSIIETPELSASFAMKTWEAGTNLFGKKNDKEYIKDQINFGWYYAYNKNTGTYNSSVPECPVFIVTLTNKSDKTIFVDLGNSFFIVYGASEPYYRPESTSTSSGKSGGAGVNLGSIAGAAGIGGALGTVAGGVNMGGGTSSSTTKVTYSQRVISIPPHASYSMSPQKLLLEENRLLLQDYIFTKNAEILDKNGWRNKKYGWSNNFTKGTVAEFPAPQTQPPFSVFVTYSTSESLQETTSINAGFYVSKVYSMHYPKDKIDLSENPLVYRGY